MNAAAVPLSSELTEPQALALAQLVKRLTWRDIRECAVDDTEAYEVDAPGAGRPGLGRSGFCAALKRCRGRGTWRPTRQPGATLARHGEFMEK